MTTIPEDILIEAVESGDNAGYCTSCGAVQGGVEPDACEYECYVCGKESVYGAAELLLMTT